MPKEDEIVMGYCMLCRSKEVEIYGSVGGWDAKQKQTDDDDNDDELKHALACKEAKCNHFCIYIIDHENKQTIGVLYDTIIDSY